MIEGGDLLPERDLAAIRRYCAGRVPERVAHQYRIEIEVKGRVVTILECRTPWSPHVRPEWTRLPVARLRYIASRGSWALYWPDRHLRFHEYLDVDQSPNVDTLLAEIEADPAGIFWG